MTVTSETLISWYFDDFETEPDCSETDEYYLERLFFGVESHDIYVVKSFTNEHLRYLCRIRRWFDSEWSAPEKEKQTAYQRACLLGYTDIVQYMLEAGVKVDQEFSSGDTVGIRRSAFMFACHSGSVATMRALLQALTGDYVEHYKCRNRISVCSSSFAKQYLIPQNSWIEESSYPDSSLEFVFPIHFAIAQDNLEMARQIVTSSIGELDTRSNWKSFQHGGFTPLHIACLFNRSIAMIELLLPFDDGGGNPLIQTNNQGMYADQITSERTLTEYLRPKRLSIIAALERERLKELERERLKELERERLKELEEMQPGPPYQIFIRALSGERLTFTVTDHTTTAELGTYLQSQWGIPLDGQKVLCAGRLIPTSAGEVRPLLHYNIKKDSILNVIWRSSR